MTKDEIMSQLDELGVEYDSKDKKATLEALLLEVEAVGNEGDAYEKTVEKVQKKKNVLPHTCTLKVVNNKKYVQYRKLDGATYLELVK